MPSTHPIRSEFAGLDKEPKFIFRLGRANIATSARHCGGVVLTVMERNDLCFSNSFSDYRGALHSGQGAAAIVPTVIATVDNILKKVPLDSGDCDGGLYDGPAGVAYMLFHVTECAAFSEQRDAYLKTAKQIIDASVRHVDAERDVNTRAAFLLGGAGIYAVAAMIYKAMGLAEFVKPLTKFRNLWEVCAPINFLECGSDELFVGRAGYLCAALVLKQKLGIEVSSFVNATRFASPDLHLIFIRFLWIFSFILFAEVAWYIDASFCNAHGFSTVSSFLQILRKEQIKAICQAIIDSENNMQGKRENHFHSCAHIMEQNTWVSQHAGFK